MPSCAPGRAWLSLCRDTHSCHLPSAGLACSFPHALGPTPSLALDLRSWQTPCSAGLDPLPHSPPASEAHPCGPCHARFRVCRDPQEGLCGTRGTSDGGLRSAGWAAVGLLPEKSREGGPLVHSRLCPTSELLGSPFLPPSGSGLALQQGSHLASVFRALPPQKLLLRGCRNLACLPRGSQVTCRHVLCHYRTVRSIGSSKHSSGA